MAEKYNSTLSEQGGNSLQSFSMSGFAWVSKLGRYALSDLNLIYVFPDG